MRGEGEGEERERREEEGRWEEGRGQEIMRASVRCESMNGMQGSYAACHRAGYTYSIIISANFRTILIHDTALLSSRRTC